MQKRLSSNPQIFLIIGFHTKSVHGDEQPLVASGLVPSMVLFVVRLVVLSPINQRARSKAARPLFVNPSYRTLVLGFGSFRHPMRIFKIAVARPSLLCRFVAYQWRNSVSSYRRSMNLKEDHRPSNIAPLSTHVYGDMDTHICHEIQFYENKVIVNCHITDKTTVAVSNCCHQYYK